MPKLSAGILVVDVVPDTPGIEGLRFLLVHPGGPLWKNKDLGAWSIPKGEHAADADAKVEAQREFTEELGVACPGGELLSLGSIRQPSGKIVTAWCVVGTLDTTLVRSNSFEMMWPPRSNRLQQFPEVDRAEFFDAETAATKILVGQREFLQRAASAVLEVR